jgi:NSS family neurotransmitter:Na+ symporter
MARPRETWSGRLGFILATIGSAVGLGSIWKFPYEVGSNGGGAFVLTYLAGLAFIVLPLMFAEFAIGRRGGGDAATSIETVAASCGASRFWGLVGILGIVTGFLILSFYSVIGGWTIAYALETIWYGLPHAEAQAVRARYEDLLGSPVRLSIYHAVFMTITAIVVARGVSRGIEAAAKVLMPILIVLMLGLAIYSMVQGDARAALHYLFRPDVSHFTARAAVEAIGLGFFSIGVGMSLMITYGAYAKENIDLKEVAIVSIVADTAISLLAGMTVFPIVFAHKLDPAAGAGLVFVTLPLAFAAIPYGHLAAISFFVLLFVAALASAISILELAVAFLVRRCNWRRQHASFVAGALCFVLGLASVLSFNLWSDWFPLGAGSAFAKATVFDLLDDITSNMLLPLIGLALAVFAGWVLPVDLLMSELRVSARSSQIIRGLLRYVVPAGILAATFGAYVR